MKKVTDSPAKQAHKAWKRHRPGWKFKGFTDEARIELAFENGYCAAIRAQARASKRRGK